MSRTDNTNRPTRPVRIDNPEEGKNHLTSASKHGPSLRDDIVSVRVNRPLLTPEETIQLAHATVENGIQETKRSLAGSEAVEGVVRPKLTVDLGNKCIGRVPDEIVDIIQDEVERLSLANNYIDDMPYRFQECIHLRYLNIRANRLTKFPKGIYHLKLLEILDLSRNKITTIPPEIQRLTSLRVLSVEQNLIEDLPCELADMNGLQRLKVTGNPLKYPLQRILDMKGADTSTAEMIDNTQLDLTAELKKYLKSKQLALYDAESATDTSDNAPDTPKPPKRGNRFPVIPRTNESSSDSKSPSYTRPPPIPLRSHHRIASGQGSFGHPGINRFKFPLTSERNRSNSEGGIQNSTSLHTKRLGLISRMNDLGTLDEVRPYRNSHFRGLSHGSLLRNQHSSGSSRSNSSSPVSPKDRRNLHGFPRRMSSLPEYKTEKRPEMPILEAARTVLYSLYQVHPQVSALINVIKAEECRRTSLEIVFYNASTHIEQLNEALGKAEAVNQHDKDTAKRLSDAVKHECDTCINAYIHVITLFRHNITKIVSLADPRYVRSLLLMVYGSLAELRNVHTSLEVDAGTTPTIISPPATPVAMKPEDTNTARKVPPIITSEQTVTPPAKERSQPVRRLRSETAIQTPVSVPLNIPGSTVRKATSAAQTQPWTATLSNGTRSRSSSRSNTLLTSSGPSSLANTPRSGESFTTVSTSNASRINPMTGLDEYEEERIFEKIFVQLTAAYRSVLQAVPIASQQISQCLELTATTDASQRINTLLNKLISRCRYCLEVAEALKLRLSTMKLKEPGGGMRNQREFWQLCRAFVQSFVELVLDMREAKNLRLLPSDIAAILRPVQKANKIAGRLIDTSPWSSLAELNTPNPSAMAPPQVHHVQNLSQSTTSSATTTGSTALTTGSSPQSVIMPATPLSAALGPAARATVPCVPAAPLPPLKPPVPTVTAVPPQPSAPPTPSVPINACSDQFFAGNLYERADSLLSMSGPVPLIIRR